MKVNVSDIVKVKACKTGAVLSVKVEDASKSDIIGGKVEAISGDAKDAAYQVGQVCEFSRDDIIE